MGLQLGSSWMARPLTLESYVQCKPPGPGRRRRSQMNIKRIAVIYLVLIVGFGALQTPAVFAGASQEVPFKGSLVGNETDTFTPPNLIQVNGFGSGNATHVGLFTLDYQVLVDLTTGSGPASAQLTSANGDTFFCEGNGQATETGVPGLVMVTESYAIVSGTGRFADATGQFTVVRQVNLITGDTSGEFSGSIMLH